MDKNQAEDGGETPPLLIVMQIKKANIPGVEAHGCQMG